MHSFVKSTFIVNLLIATTSLTVCHWQPIVLESGQQPIRLIIQAVSLTSVISSSLAIQIAKCEQSNFSRRFSSQFSQVPFVRELFYSIMSTDSIRFCHPGNFDQFFELMKDKGRFKGHFGPVANDILEYCDRITGNKTSFIVKDGAGEPIGTEGKFSGCIGSLQKNESDILFYTSDYPMNADNVEQGFVLFETILVIGQDYYVKKTSKDGQIFDSLDSLYYIMPFIALFILVVTGLLHLRWVMRMQMKRQIMKFLNMSHRRIKKVNCYFFYYVVAHATRNGTIPDKMFYDRLIFTCLSVFSLYVIHYYNSLIKTSLVVIREPDLWYSYQDLIDSNIRPFFISGMHEEYYYQYAPEGSPRRKLWQYMKDNFNASDRIVQANFANFPPHGIAMIRRQAALIIDLLLSKTVQLAACNFKARRTELYSIANAKVKLDADLLERAKKYMFFSAVDPSESAFQKGLILSKFFTGKAANMMRRGIRHSIEGGIQFGKLETVQSTDIFSQIDDVHRRDPAKSRWVRDCMSDSIITPHAGIVSDIEVVNIAKLFYVFVGLLFACKVMFILEKYYFLEITRISLARYSARRRQWRTNSRIIFQNFIRFPSPQKSS